MRFSLALVFVAVTAHAQLTLGPEQLPTPFEPQTPVASFAAMASSANGSLIVFQTSLIHGQLLDADGGPLTQRGFPITSSGATAGGVASNGSNYVVAVTENKTVKVITVSLTGEVSAPRDVGTFTLGVERARVASNGHGYFVTFVAISNDGRPVVCGHHLDADGVPVGTNIPISIGLTTSLTDHTVASNGSDYLSSYTILQPWPPDPGKGNEVSLVPVIGNFARDRKSGMHRLLQLGSAPSYLVAFNEPNDAEAYAALADASGALGGRTVIGDGDVVSVAGNVVLLRDKNGAFQAVRLAGISPVESRPLGISGGDALLGMTSRGEPVVFRASPLDFAVVRPGPLTWHPLVTVGTRQWFPGLVNAGDVDVMTWSEQLGTRATRLRHGIPIDVPALSVSPIGTSVASVGGEGRALFIWTERFQWFGRFFGADGTLSPPFLIAAAANLSFRAAVWNGRNFIVAWEGNDGLWFSRIDAAGNVLATAPLDLAVTPSGGYAVYRPNAELLPTSFGFLLLYTEVIATSRQRADVFAAAFRDDGTPLGTRVPVRASIDAKYLNNAASDGHGHRLASISVLPANGSEPRVDVVPLDERGNVTGDGSSPARNSGWLAWNGTEFLFLPVFLAPGAVLDVHGNVVKRLDPLPIAFSPSAFTPEAVAYERLEDGDVNRVFVRRIIPPRRRATR
ncbi:MAG TPA: hypothetical protein VI670_17465 [Thermoanaerobaculia bacterium]|jgi:hypothetical protein